MRAGGRRSQVQAAVRCIECAERTARFQRRGHHAVVDQFAFHDMGGIADRRLHRHRSRRDGIQTRRYLGLPAKSTDFPAEWLAPSRRPAPAARSRRQQLRRRRARIRHFPRPRTRRARRHSERLRAPAHDRAGRSAASPSRCWSPRKATVRYRRRPDRPGENSRDARHVRAPHRHRSRRCAHAHAASGRRCHAARLARRDRRYTARDPHEAFVFKAVEAAAQQRLGHGRCMERGQRQSCKLHGSAGLAPRLVQLLPAATPSCPPRTGYPAA